MSPPLGNYLNGNHSVVIYPDGTKIKSTISSNSKIFTYDFPESFDFKINNRCSARCPYCHENSNPLGKCPSLKEFSQSPFFQSIHPYTEIAIGGGNPFESSDLEFFLQKTKDKNIIANITISQKHLQESFSILKKWKDEKLVFGIGISLTNSSNEKDFSLIDSLGENVVIHAINGIVSEKDFSVLEGRKVLLLGYKDLGRGNLYLSENSSLVFEKQKFLQKNLKAFSENCKLLSFDNLAIKQLCPQKTLEIPTDEYENLFDGEDNLDCNELGENICGTMFVDYPKLQISRSSIFEKRFPLDLNKTIEENFRKVYHGN